MSYLLDTDAAIAIIRNRPTSVRLRLRRAHQAGDDILLSSISLFELWFGVDRSARVEENTASLVEFLSGPVEIIDFDEIDAARAGLLRADLAAAGTPIGPYDLLIAAQAARRGHVLATGNAREFARVKDLQTENWLTSPDVPV